MNFYRVHFFLYLYILNQNGITLPNFENKRHHKFFRKFRLFFLFFLLSLFFWFFLALSAPYSYWIKARLEIKQTEKNKFTQEIPVKNIILKVKSSGFKMIYLYFIPKTLKLSTADFINAKSFKYYYLPNKNIKNLQQKWNQPQIEYFEKDSIFIYLGLNINKKIPVKSNFKLHLKSGFSLNDKIKITPDSIYVSGPEMQLKNILYQETEPVEIFDLKSDFTKIIKLAKPKNNTNNLIFSQSTIQISGKISKFTEIQLELPIQIKHNINDKKINYYPQTTVLFYQVSIENFKKTKASDFEITVNIPSNNTSIYTSLPLKLTKKPNYIKTYRMEPSTLHYWIQ